MKVVREVLAEACRITQRNRGLVMGGQCLISESERMDCKVLTGATNQIIPNWDCLHANQKLTSSKHDILISSC